MRSIIIVLGLPGKRLAVADNRINDSVFVRVGPLVFASISLSVADSLKRPSDLSRRQDQVYDNRVSAGILSISG